MKSLGLEGLKGLETQGFRKARDVTSPRHERAISRGLSQGLKAYSLVSTCTALVSLVTCDFGFTKPYTLKP